MRPGRRKFGWACLSATRRRGLPFIGCLVYESILKLRPGEENDTYWHPATANLLVLSNPVRLLADLVGFEPLGGRAVELVTGVSRIDLNNKRSLCLRPVFPTGISPVKLHHRAWTGGYVHGD